MNATPYVVLFRKANGSNVSYELVDHTSSKDQAIQLQKEYQLKFCPLVQTVVIIPKATFDQLGVKWMR